MSEFLILEDDTTTREALHGLLREEFPQARIDTAGNLADAIRLAREIAERGEHYDVALLDVLLPLDDSGGKDNLFPKARRQLLEILGHEPVVINYSAHANEARIQQFINDERNVNTPLPVLVTASPSLPWHEEVLRDCRRAVYGRRIAEGLARVLRTGHAALARTSGVAARAGRGYGETALVDLVRDIKLHWADLDDELRDRIRHTFDIREVDGEVLVNF
jgi:CheY-like chemotaxis protein